MPRIVYIGFVLLTFSTSLVAHSAEVRLSGNKLCAFSLEGPISIGDFERLSNLIAGSKIDELDERTFTLCVQSNGGSYSEAIRISELLYARGIATVIEPGARCFSACAIIFMAGTSAERIIPLRKLSARGLLGFHAPFLAMPDRKYSKAEIENAAQAMREAVLQLLRLSSKEVGLGGDFIKKSLITKILEKGPQEVLFVRTISEAARWDILIYDAAENYRINTHSMAGMKNLCNNFHHANMDQAVPSVIDLSIKFENYASRFHRDDFRILVVGPNRADTICELYAREDRKGRTIFRGCSFDYRSSRNFGDCREYKTALLFGKYVPEFFALDPNTLLKSFER